MIPHTLPGVLSARGPAEYETTPAEAAVLDRLDVPWNAHAIREASSAPQGTATRSPIRARVPEEQMTPAGWT